MKNLHDFFIAELDQMYDAEKQITKALPHAIEAVSSKELKEALRKHLKESEEQVRRLEAIFRELGRNFSGESCKVMESLLKEADKVLQSDFESHVKDAALINCAQHVEHFEIASYGTLKSLAKIFKYDHILKLLEESSKEEGHADKKLTEIAEGSIFSKGINAQATKRAA